MNYLAHAYLSFNQPEVVVGNIISDYIKGKKQYDYPLPIQKGIRLHRAIDTFTDSHPVVRQAKQFLKPAVGLYAGAFIDVAFDHYLALDTTCFNTPEALTLFAENTYKVLEDHKELLPELFKKVFPYMKQNNWLYNYQFAWGIEKSFANIARRANYLSSAEECFRLWEQHYDAIHQLYKTFFPELKAYSFDYLNATTE
jgi:acyl carrier protein phosphodiesterase